MQVKLLTKSLQVPPLRQGRLPHSSSSVSQRGPPNPGGQEQEKVPTPSWQVPPFRQGSGWGTHIHTQRGGDPWHPELAPPQCPQAPLVSPKPPSVLLFPTRSPVSLSPP